MMLPPLTKGLELLRKLGAHLAVQHGYTHVDHDQGARTLARAAALDTRPLRVFVEWLALNPEAADQLDNLLSGECCAMALAPPAQTSEPVAVMSQTGAVVNGIRGATAPSVVIQNSADAARLLGVSEFRTRPVSPEDVVGSIPAMAGHEPVADAEGKVLQAMVKPLNGKAIACNFLGKSGTVIMARAVGKGRQVINCAEASIEPGRRAEVVAVLNQLPGALDEFNFDPFEGMEDPWAPAEAK